MVRWLPDPSNPFKMRLSAAAAGDIDRRVQRRGGTPEMERAGPRTPRVDFEVQPGSRDDFAQWRWAVSPLFDVESRVSGIEAGYAASSVNFLFGGTRVGCSTMSTSRFDRSPYTIARSGLDDVLVQMYVAGGYSLDMGREAVEVRAGDIALIDLGRPVTLQSQAFTVLTAVIPRAALSPYLRSPEDAHGVVLRSGAPLNTILRSHLTTLLAEGPGLAAHEGEAVAQGTAALIGACFSPPAEARMLAAEDVSPAVLQMVRRTIDANLARPDLGPAFLMRRFGMSRASLYRLFHPLGGVSSFIQQRRLAQARRWLLDPARSHERISSIAEASGFASDTAFGRAFRHAFGMTPSEARAGVLTGEHASWADAGTEGSFAGVYRWLAGARVQPTPLIDR